jgi:hypothetical protein
MDGEAFEDLIDRLRGDMSSWPDAKRHAGKILLTSSRKAQPLIEQAWTLRATLTVPAPSYPCGSHGRDAGRDPSISSSSTTRLRGPRRRTNSQLFLWPVLRGSASIHARASRVLRRSSHIKCNAANRMGTAMGYRDDFYVVENMSGYTGDIHDNPTVYFYSYEEHGRITQDHHRKDNIGRDVVKTNTGHSIEKVYDDKGVLRSVFYERFEGYRVFDIRHRSRGQLVWISETTTAGDWALLSQSIWRYTELKKNRRRISV